MLTVYTAPVTVPYYIGRNVAHAIDPIHGESRFHEAILNPIGTIPKTHGHLATIARQSYISGAYNQTAPPGSLHSLLNRFW